MPVPCVSWGLPRRSGLKGKFLSERAEGRSSKAKTNYKQKTLIYRRTTCLRKFRPATRRYRGETVARASSGPSVALQCVSEEATEPQIQRACRQEWHHLGPERAESVLRQESSKPPPFSPSCQRPLHLYTATTSELTAKLPVS